METYRLTLDNRIDEITHLSEFLTGLHLSVELTYRLNLVLEEVVANVIRYAHAKSPIEVSLTGLEEVLMVEIIDDGVAFDPLAVQEPDITLSVEERPIGGLGLLLVRTMTATQTYRRDAGRNILTLTVAIR